MTQQNANNGKALDGAVIDSDDWRADAAQAGDSPPEQNAAPVPSSGTVTSNIARDAANDPAATERETASSGAEADAAKGSS